MLTQDYGDYGGGCLSGVEFGRGVDFLRSFQAQSPTLCALPRATSVLCGDSRRVLLQFLYRSDHDPSYSLRFLGLKAEPFRYGFRRLFFDNRCAEIYV